MNVPAIQLLVVDDHQQYAGRKAILHEREVSLFVDIVRTTRVVVVVKHADGSLQKVPWGKLSVALMEIG